MITRHQTAKIRRRLRTHRKIRASKWLRLAVFRSSKHTYAQIVDDQKGITLVSASTINAKASGHKTSQATKIGETIAQKALTAKITTVAFDRGSYKYHGRVKAVAEGARSQGLKV